MSEFIVVSHWSADSPFGFMSAPLADGTRVRLFQTVEHANSYAEQMNHTRGTGNVFYAPALRDLFEQRVGPIPDPYDTDALSFAKPRGEVSQADYETRALLLGWRQSDAPGLWTRNPIGNEKMAPLRSAEEICQEVENASAKSLAARARDTADHMTYLEASRDLRIGDVVVSVSTLESYPHYSIEPGARFVVVCNDLNEMQPLLSLRLVPDDGNNLQAGNLAEWGNAVEFYSPEWEGYEHDPGIHDDDRDQPGHAWNKAKIAIRKDNSALEFTDRLAAVFTYRLAKGIGSTLMETIVSLNSRNPDTEECASAKFAETGALIESIYQEMRGDQPAEVDPDLVEDVKSRARLKYFLAYAPSPDDEEGEAEDTPAQSPSAVAPNPLAEPLLELLQYVGGWDLTDANHPIVKARRAYEATTGVKL